MSRPCRLLIDPPGAGAWNMALDEALLSSVQESRCAALRFYSWSEPTLSLGYFQPYENRERHAESLPCAVVRRASGGGAILHDNELTYSLAIADSDGERFASAPLYQAVHEALVSVLQRFGVKARMAGESNDEVPSPGPFLCFARRSPHDVLAGKHKLCGSAQRRKNGALLQHGSLILGRSPFAPEVSGVTESTGVWLSADRFTEYWAAAIAHRLKLNLAKSQPTDAEKSAAQRIAEEKFAADAWTRRR
jgi:lipoate-protein ligase A